MEDCKNGIDGGAAVIANSFTVVPKMQIERFNNHRHVGIQSFI